MSFILNWVLTREYQASRDKAIEINEDDMPIPSSSTTTSDLEKLLSVFSSLRSANDIFDVFGVGNLPQAQKYGIILGIVTFTVTVSAVIILLILGGSFKRIATQAEDAESGIMPNSIEQRLMRPLLLERLLEASERMVKRYELAWMESDVKNKKKVAKYSVLTELLMNVAPDVCKAQKMMSTLSDNKGKTTKKVQKITKQTAAHRTLQDRKRQRRKHRIAPPQR